MRRHPFLGTVAAYLTGWVIAQSAYHAGWKRLRAYYATSDQWEKEKAEIVSRVTDALEQRIARGSVH